MITIPVTTWPRTRQMRRPGLLFDEAVDLEDLGEVETHVDAVGTGEVPDVVGVRVVAVLLRLVARERCDLALDVALVERDVGLVVEVERVPGDLVAEHRRPLERAETLGRDDLVILVDVAEARLQDRVGTPVLPESDQELEDLLAALRKRPDLEIVNGERTRRDPDLGGRLANLPRERVGREPLGKRFRRDREGDVANLDPCFDESRHRSAAAELTVIGMGREDEYPLPGLDHAGSLCGDIVAPMDAPILVLGVRRSGTTLLRVMLDRNPVLAVPDESYFIPQLASRHRGTLDVEAFADDLRRLPTIAEWDVPVDAVQERIRPDGELGDAIAAIYEVYAERHGKTRWGDKTPMYMQYLGLLERLFPTASYVHLIRDGRDAALSHLAVPPGIMTESWGYPRDAAGFACQWRSEVLAARGLGHRVGAGRYLEIRYEALVDDTRRELEAICAFADLPYESAMLDYPGAVDVSAKAHQQSLRTAPTQGLRDWRTEMDPAEVAAFERIAGDLLTSLDYELADRLQAEGPDMRARLALASYEAKELAWRTSGTAMQRSPLWRRRHPLL